MTEVDKVEAIEYLMSYDENIGDKWRKVEKLITEINYLLTWSKLDNDGKLFLADKLFTQKGYWSSVFVC